MEEGPVPCGSLLETLDTRVPADSPKKTKMGDVQPGDSVIIAEDNLARNRWPLGRVVEVFTGRSRGVRCSARIKTAGGVFHRPLQRHAYWKKLKVTRKPISDCQEACGTLTMLS